MDNLVKIIEESGCEKLGTVVHVGAGLCRELEGYYGLGAEQIILVEANSNSVEQLRHRLPVKNNVTLIHGAVTSQEGQTSFLLMNNPKESSLLRPDALQQWLPNLAVEREIKVPGITLEQVLEPINLQPGEANLLVLEVQGAELQVLGSTSIDILQKFAWIIVRTSKDVLYQNGADRRTLQEFIKKAGFVAKPSVKELETPPFQVVFYGRDDGLIKIKELQARINDLQNDNIKLQNSLDKQNSLSAEKQQQVENLTSNLDEQARLASQRQQELVKQSTVVSSQQEKLTAKGKQISSLQNSLDQQSRLLTEKQQQVEDLTSNLDEQARLASQRQQELVQQSTVVSSQQEKLAANGKEISSLQNSLDQQSKLSAEKQQQLEKIIQERDHQVKLAADLQRQIEQLTHTLQEKEMQIAKLDAQLVETDHRQRLLDEEMIKAEAQIDLIKDVLLREEGI